MKPNYEIKPISPESPYYIARDGSFFYRYPNSEDYKLIEPELSNEGVPYVNTKVKGDGKSRHSTWRSITTLLQRTYGDEPINPRKRKSRRKQTT